MASLLVLHGPNLNLLGTREPHIYGTTSLDQINDSLKARADAEGHCLHTFQSNAEHELVNRVQAAFVEKINFMIVNAGALTHTSIALRDAILSTGIPFIEAHISNVYARENFRHHSYLSDIATGIICGLGVQTYQLAYQAATHHLQVP